MARVSTSSGPAPRAASPVATVAARWLRPLAASALLLLAMEFLVGMLVNLFVFLPDQHPGANAPEYFSGVARRVVRAGQ